MEVLRIESAMEGTNIRTATMSLRERDIPAAAPRTSRFRRRAVRAQSTAGRSYDLIAANEADIQHTVLNRLRYSAGVVPSVLRNARLSVSVVLKPQAAAIRSSGSSVVSNRLRAISTRTDSM